MRGRGPGDGRGECGPPELDPAARKKRIDLPLLDCSDIEVLGIIDRIVIPDNRPMYLLNNQSGVTRLTPIPNSLRNMRSSEVIFGFPPIC